MSLCDPGDGISAHVVLEHMDERGVKLTAGIIVWRESLTPLCDPQLLTPLSTQQIETPRAIRHRGGAVVLTHLVEKSEEVHKGKK